jgi:bidirectional [NiFe] hydrogenase diaphorase subunit
VGRESKRAEAYSGFRSIGTIATTVKTIVMHSFTISIRQSPNNQSYPQRATDVATHQGNDPRYKALDLTMKRYQHSPDALIEILHKAQSSFGYLEDPVLIYISRGLQLPLSQVYGVATFYHLFTLKPSGAHTCIVCTGTACHVRGSSQLIAVLEAELGISMGKTTPDGQISLLAARCLGACGIAPVIVIDGLVSGKETPEDAVNKVKVLKS